MCGSHPVDDRRRFLEMSLAAVSATVAGATHAAEPARSEGATLEQAQRPTYLVIYRPGPAWIAGKSMSGQALRPHGRYMLDLYRQGVLRFAGAFTDDSGGAVMFEATDDAHAATIPAADPAVTAQIFVYELHRWKLVPWEKIAQDQG